MPTSRRRRQSNCSTFGRQLANPASSGGEFGRWRCWYSISTRQRAPDLRISATLATERCRRHAVHRSTRSAVLRRCGPAPERAGPNCVGGSHEPPPLHPTSAPSPCAYCPENVRLAPGRTGCTRASLVRTVPAPVGTGPKVTGPGGSRCRLRTSRVTLRIGWRCSWHRELRRGGCHGRQRPPRGARRRWRLER